MKTYLFKLEPAIVFTFHIGQTIPYKRFLFLIISTKKKQTSDLYYIHGGKHYQKMEQPKSLKTRFEIMITCQIKKRDKVFTKKMEFFSLNALVVTIMKGSTVETTFTFGFVSKIRKNRDVRKPKKMGNQYSASSDHFVFSERTF